MSTTRGDTLQPIMGKRAGGKYRSNKGSVFHYPLTNNRKSALECTIVRHSHPFASVGCFGFEATQSLLNNTVSMRENMCQAISKRFSSTSK